MRTLRSPILGLLAVCVLTGVHPAAAQGPPSSETKGFISLNAGAQPQVRTIQTSQSFNLYDETATVTSNQPIANGPMFEVSAGYRVRPRFGLAVGVSSFSGSASTSTVTASIPDPIFVDRPKIVTSEQPDLSHSELGIHVQAIWFIPVSDKFDVALSAGPSFIRVKQEISTVSVAPGTQDVIFTPETETGTATGVNVGMDASYMFRPRFGVGLFFRWAGGSVDLPSVPDLKVGGFQGGLGIRLRF